MRFNFLLLLLTALTAVALSQELPCRVKIQSVNRSLPPRYQELPYLLLASHGGNVILTHRGLNWTIVPCARTLCPEGGSSIDLVHGESVQFNGLNKALTIAKTRKDKSQCWHFQGGAKSATIVSCKDRRAYATGANKEGSKVYASRHLIGARQEWVFHKVK